MNASKYPRVAWMEYFIRLPAGYDLAKGLLQSGRIGDFDYVFTWHRAEFLPRRIFATVEDARSVLDPLLEAWRVSAFLSLGPAALSFEYTDCSVEQSSPDEGNTAAKRRRAGPMPPTLTLAYDGYPPVPDGIAVDDCVRDVSEHFYAAESNHRALLLHTYAIVTRVKAEYHGLELAAQALNVSKKILMKMKHYATVRGVGVGARKFDTAAPREALSTDEDIWLRAMNRELLFRCARIAAGKPPGRKLSNSVGTR